MVRKPKPLPDDLEQSKRYIDAAREIITDESPEAFERVFKRVVRASTPISGPSGSSAIWAILFSLQNEITSRIAVSLNLELIGAETSWPTARPDALDYIICKRAAFRKPLSRDSYAEAISMYEGALAPPHRHHRAQGGVRAPLILRLSAKLSLQLQRGRAPPVIPPSITSSAPVM